MLSPDGWLRTGDLGFVDAEGYLYVTGRLKDVIILGGQNIVPADVEEIVDRVDGVRYSAAVGIENERTGSQRLHVVAEVREPDGPARGHVPPGPRHRPARARGARTPPRARPARRAGHDSQDLLRQDPARAPRRR